MKRRDFLRSSAALSLGLGLSGCLSFGSRTPPNILMVVSDDASFPHMSAYGCDWVDSPGFDRVAREGLLFTRAYTPNAKCGPSRSCMLTGRNSWSLEEAANHVCDFPAKFKTYPEVFKDNGYHTGYTGKGWAPGNPGVIDGKKRELTGKAYNSIKIKPPPAKWIGWDDYFENFKKFYGEKAESQPFCFWFGAREPHRPYKYGIGIEGGKKKLKDIDRVFSFYPDNETVRTDMLDYAYEIGHYEKHLEKMLNFLEEKGELDNTLVIVTSDNGMPFPRIKGQNYEYSNHLPFAVMWKNGIKNPGRTVDDYVNVIDIVPTLLETAGISERKSGMRPVQGNSLTDIFDSSKSGTVTPERDHILIGKERHDVGRPGDAGYPVRGIFKDDFLYQKNYNPERWPSGNPETGYLNTDGSPTKTLLLKGRKNPETKKYWDWSFGKKGEEELYNIKEDPDCINNLIDKEGYQDKVQELKAQLFRELKEQKDPRALGQGHIFDNYIYSQPKHRNFYERHMKGEKIKTGWVNPSDYEPDFPD